MWAAQTVEVPDGELSDDALCALLRQHLRLDASAAFSAQRSPSNGERNKGQQASAAQGPATQQGALSRRGRAERGQHGGAVQGGPVAGEAAARPLTLEAFVARTLPLIELEREAEVAQARCKRPVPRSSCLGSCAHQCNTRAPETVHGTTWRAHAEKGGTGLWKHVRGAG